MASSAGRAGLIREELQHRIVVLDGAMGTMIQRHELGEEDFRGQRFADTDSDLFGANDILCLSQPALIRDIHAEYLEAGADLDEQLSINSTLTAGGVVQRRASNAGLNAFLLAAGSACGLAGTLLHVAGAFARLQQAAVDHFLTHHFCQVRSTHGNFGTMSTRCHRCIGRFIKLRASNFVFIQHTQQHNSAAFF